MKTKILSILALLLMTVTQGAWAQETLTVYEDASVFSEYVPVNGWNADNYLKCEFVIPATEISAMEGGTISQMTFYLKQSATKAWTGTFQVFLKEVNSTTISAYSGTEGATTVYTGTLDATGSTMTIPFSTIYTYRGGNLLVGIYETAKGNFERAYFYGVTATGASGQYYISSSLDGVSFVQQNFIPKTTFTYTPAPDPVDLGLPSGKKWANRNVNAGSATGIGTYFEWGETTAYDNNNSYSGNNPTTLPLSNDAAYANWGSNWRMPTKAEYDELLNETYTTWTWYEDYNSTGVGGYLVTSKTNGNSIFLPKTGYMKDGSLNAPTRCDYWSSTINGSNNNEAYALGVGINDKGTWNFSRSFGFPIRPVQMFAGEGTEASPYLIASTTDWNNLSAAVNGGETYSGKFFKMTANIGTVTTMIGVCTQTEEKKFLGVFDGGGHTLTVNYSYNEDWRRTCPFPYTGASTVIRNLTVAGSITNSMRASGLVGTADGAKIQNCRVSATISGNPYTAAFTVSGGQIENCLFDGKLTGTAGFVGYRGGSGTSITNCLFKPQTGSSIPQCTFYSYEGNGAATVTNSYYTSLAGSTYVQGTDGSGMTPAQLVENLGPSNWKVVDSNAIPKVHPGLSGEGTEDSPYLIASTTDWNNLVSAVNGGETYSGNYFKMTANVGTVSTWMTGTFSGTFDGVGNTLTVGYSSSASGCAPFGNLRAATIKNLVVDGTIATSGERAGGIAFWVLEGNMTYITNCRVSATINSTVSGGASTGGFVGSVQDYGTDGKLTITGCAFTGSLLGSSTHTCGGFVGWNGGTLTIENSLFAPASVTMGTTYSATFTRGGTVTNSYYTQKFNTAQGIQARTIAAGDYVSSLSVTKGNATATYTVSGITVYSSGIDFNDGSTTTFYGGSGQTVSLALTPEERSGYLFKQYAASQGTLSDQTTDTPTLTMPDANSTANDVVTISAEYDPLYNATFASGNDNDGWEIDPTQQIAGGTVTVSYKGENKVKSVTVTKLALCSLSEVTSEHVGKIIGADGNVYASLAQAEKVTSAVGVLGKVTETGHGLIMSLEDAPKQVWATIDGWTSASYAGTTLKVLPDDDARGSNLPSYTTLGSTTVSNWAVATRADYTAIFTNLGSTGGDSDGISYDANMNAKITGAGGTAISGENWSSTQYDSSKAWRFASTWGGRDKTTQFKVRPVLGF